MTALFCFMEEDMNKDIFVKTLKLRHQLHQNPELSGEEVETRKRLKKFLSENPVDFAF